MLGQVEALEDGIAAVSQQITTLIEPWQPATVPRLDHRSRGTDRRGSPGGDRPGHEPGATAPHLGPWAGRCPRVPRSHGATLFHFVMRLIFMEWPSDRGGCFPPLFE
jgi:hypothetical protein